VGLFKPVGDISTYIRVRLFLEIESFTVLLKNHDGSDDAN